jgi:hypothetical protein
MADWVRRALTRKVARSSVRGEGKVTVIQPDEKLVYATKFALGMTACLTTLEIAYIAFMHSWNSEVFSAITGLSGVIVGIFMGAKT